MIEFLFREHFPVEEISNFLQGIFGLNDQKVLVIHINEFNDVNYGIDVDNLSCLCVYSEISGDASLLVRLYRYSMDDDILMKNIIEAARKTGMACYVPVDDFDGWILSGDEGEDTKGKQVESNDLNTFYFKKL